MNKENSRPGKIIRKSNNKYLMAVLVYRMKKKSSRKELNERKYAFDKIPQRNIYEKISGKDKKPSHHKL